MLYFKGRLATLLFTQMMTTAAPHDRLAFPRLEVQPPERERRYSLLKINPLSGCFLEETHTHSGGGGGARVGKVVVVVVAVGGERVDK